MSLLALFFLPHAYLLLTHSSLNIHANSHSYPLSLPLSLPPSLSPSTSPLNQTEQVGTCRSELLWPATSAGVLPAPNTGDGPDHAGPGSGFQSVAFVSRIPPPPPLVPCRVRCPPFPASARGAGDTRRPCPSPACLPRHPASPASPGSSRLSGSHLLPA